MTKNLYKLHTFQILLLASLFFAFLSGYTGSSSGHLRADSAAAVIISPLTKTVPLGGTLWILKPAVELDLILLM